MSDDFGPDILPPGFSPVTVVTHDRHIGRFSSNRTFKFYLPKGVTHREVTEVIKAFADIAQRMVERAEAEEPSKPPPPPRIVLPS